MAQSQATSIPASTGQIATRGETKGMVSAEDPYSVVEGPLEDCDRPHRFSCLLVRVGEGPAGNQGGWVVGAENLFLTGEGLLG